MDLFVTISPYDYQHFIEYVEKSHIDVNFVLRQVISKIVQIYSLWLYYECYFLKVQVILTNQQCNFMKFPCDAILYIYLLLQEVEWYVTLTVVFCFTYSQI